LCLGGAKEMPTGGMRDAARERLLLKEAVKLEFIRSSFILIRSACSSAKISLFLASSAL